MKHLVVVVLALLLAACSPPQSGTLGAAPTGVPLPTLSAPSGKTITIQVWFVRAGKVFPTKRTAPYTLETSHLAMTELLAGPSAVEAAAGVTNAMPIGLSYTLSGINDGVATLDLPARFFTDSLRLRQAQVVYTLTQYPTVSRVDFSDGAPPLGRADFADLVPAIAVLSPAIGQRVSSPLTLTGTADTPEATVNARLLDSAGHEIATRFANATCGNGCRGTYSMSLTYQGCAEQDGRLEVYQVSAQDGSRRDIVAIPLVLAAC